MVGFFVIKLSCRDMEVSLPTATMSLKSEIATLDHTSIKE